jgi:diacylglycerol diphosphate phosphatase/phosphatidate phosphatase
MPAPAAAAARPGCLRALLPEVAAAAALLALGFGLDALPPFDSTFYERDPALSKERLDASIPTSLLLVLCAILPALLLLLIHAAAHCRSGKGGWLQPHLLLGLALALGATLLTVDVLKNAIGSKRPNFFAYCGYANFAAASGARDASSPAWAAYLNATAAGAPGALSRCAAAPALVRDAQRSFPSGHSALSFAGLGFLALALRGALGLRAGDFLSPPALLAGLPLALAAWVAATRVRENWHREIDVTAGALLGLCFAHCAMATLRARGALPPLLVGGGSAAAAEAAALKGSGGDGGGPEADGEAAALTPPPV